MKRIFAALCLFFCLTPTLFSLPASGAYHRADSLTEAGLYPEAEIIYRDLYESTPEKYQYYQKYKDILVRQRKFSEIIRLLQDRSARYSHNLSYLMELGVLNWHQNNREKAVDLWEEVYRRGKRSFSNSYAVIAYNRINTYRLMDHLSPIISELRRISGDETLLYRQYFTAALRYMQWGNASDELLHLIRVRPARLTYFTRQLFKLKPELEVFDLCLEKLRQIPGDMPLIVRSQIHFYRKNFKTSLQILESAAPNSDILSEMRSCLANLEKQNKYKLAAQCAAHLLRHERDPLRQQALLLRKANNLNRHIRQNEISVSRIRFPYESRYTRLPYRSYEPETMNDLQTAMAIYDSLITLSPALRNEAILKRSNILKDMLNNPQSAEIGVQQILEKEYNQSSFNAVVALSKIFMMTGRYNKADSLLAGAATNLGLTALQEDRLLPYQSIARFLSSPDSTVTENLRTAADLMDTSHDDYNDCLSLMAVMTTIMADTADLAKYQAIERDIIRNKLTSALEKIFRLSTDKDASMIYFAKAIDIMRYLEIQNKEKIFWEKYSSQLLEHRRADFFLFRYAEFLQSEKKNDSVIEYYEKILINYTDSPYADTAREIIRSLRSKEVQYDE